MDHFKIKGKLFKPVRNSTMRHDIWTTGQIERAGLSRLNKEEDETPREFADRVYRTAITNGDVFLLLGGLVMPFDIDYEHWTLEIAKQTADFLANVTAEEDKLLVNSLVLSTLTSFFTTGLASLTTSPNFSPIQTREEKAAGQPKGITEIAEA